MYEMRAIKTAARKTKTDVDDYLYFISIGKKWCTKCKEWKNRSYFNKDSSRGDGYSSRCMECKNSKKYPTKLDRIEAKSMGLDWCCVCKEWKNESDVKNGRCGPHLREYQREHYVVKSEEIRAQKAARKRSTEVITKEKRRIVTEAFDGKCVYCGDEGKTIDHITPVILGGGASYFNLVPACQSCNSSKRDKTFTSWAKGQSAKEVISNIVHFGGTIYMEASSSAKFNVTNDSIDWAPYSWNPVTGCKHGCSYCYARSIAKRFPQAFPKGFEPDFRPERLVAPKNTKTPKDKSKSRNVFVCSMADLFGEWVPQEWIDRVLDTCRQYSQWNYIFLTKNPARLVDQKWPRNAWVGTTVDEQKRVGPAMEAMAKLRESRYTPTATFLSCEPFLTELTFPDGALKNVDWVIIGAMKDGFQPQPEWVLKLQWQAYSCGCKIYDKPNLKTRFKQYPIAVIGEEEKQAGLM